jgi:hypothetical protein
MKTNMSLLNASVMHFRAVATKAATTIETILENPHGFEGSTHIDEILKQTKILSDADAAMKMLQANFLSPLADQRQKQRFASGEAPQLTPEQQEQLEAFRRKHPKSGPPPELYPVAPDTLDAKPSKKKPKTK